MKRILFLLFCYLSLAVTAQSPVRHVDAATFKLLLNDSSSASELIDLRTTEEMRTKGFIKGARQIDFLDKDAEILIDSLDREKTYFIYCAGGGRSGECAELMTKKGFRRVIELEKGFDDWKRKGYGVEKLP